MRKSVFLSAALASAALVSAPAASAHTVVVYAGGPGKWASSLGNKYGAGVNNFLINKVVINAGDTVEWDGASLKGGFHTVDIPKPHGADLALLVPTGQKVSGAKDAAGSPFWFNGLPSVGFNPMLFKPLGGSSYNAKGRIDSGLPVGKASNFKVKFLTPGTFKYYCDVHAGMGGVVIVKGKKASIPTAQQNAAVLAREEAGYVKSAKQALRTKVPANEVSLGQSAAGGLEVFAMFPATLTVKAGTTVKFFMSAHSREVHTATFGPVAYRGTLAASFGGPAPAPAALYPSDPPGHGLLSPTSHGNGFASTGALTQDNGAPLPAFGAITFTTPGTYAYECLIHTFMHGTIIVTK